MTACPTCHEPMTVDVLVAQDAIRALDPGTPAPVLLRCRHGHTHRLAPPEGPASPRSEPAHRPTPRCAICGVEIPRERGAAPRKSCSYEHRREIARLRHVALMAHRRLHGYDTGFHFPLEAQPWFQGVPTAITPRPPVAEPEARPLFPEIPADWLAGFRTIYPTIEGPAPEPVTFAPPEELDEEFQGRLYRQRRRPDAAAELAAARVEPA